ncbi:MULTISPECIES: hypothetical protein [unclassified Burkholderia]|uniref:hypothetical protein n=1 Tax=unclassified Burkholderia TaxID=2613784 RepID=UPI0015883712|nr:MULTISPECIES: hypothetical protein [unclassified Burkholderia]
MRIELKTTFPLNPTNTMTKTINMLSKFLFSAAFFVAVNPSFSQPNNDQPNALLEISINGVVHKGEVELMAEGINDAATTRQFIEQNSIRLPKGGSVQLKITLITSDGKRQDVTNNVSNMWTLNQTGWLFQVKAPGLLVQQPGPAYASNQTLMNSTFGEITYVYKNGNVIAYNSVYVRVVK